MHMKTTSVLLPWLLLLCPLLPAFPLSPLFFPVQKMI